MMRGKIKQRESTVISPPGYKTTILKTKEQAGHTKGHDISMYQSTTSRH